MWFNKIIRFILLSPLHPIMSANTMLLTWIGAKSGKTYSTPVDFQRQGEQLITTSTRTRTWWRSLRNGSPVTLQLQGKTVQAVPRVLDTDESVAPALQRFLETAPASARYFNIRLDENKKPRPEDVATEAAKRVIIYFTPAASPQ
jgi:deazaflavin-dependent oxidoreductase (nitroreductase family)